MTEKRFVFIAMLTVMLIIMPVGFISTPFCAEPIAIDHNCIDASQIPQQFLDTAREIDVLFNHQSIGNNILSGLEVLAALDPQRYSCNIMPDPSIEWYMNNSGFGHFMEGSNQFALTKVDAFEHLMTTSGYGAHVDVAMMKFSYIDFDDENGWWCDDIDIPCYTGEEIWNYYRPVMETLEAAYPNVTFVWWTCALNQWWANHGHEEFNALVRQYCAANNKPLFDLAAIESHDPDGNPVVDFNGFPALYDGYTLDGGHLNDEGDLLLANAWWWLMARLAGWDPNASPTNDCEFDSEGDGDVDGLDLAAFQNGFNGEHLEGFAAQFGRMDCLQNP